MYDGKDASAELVQTFCANTFNQEQFESSGPYMYIEFHSDRKYEAQGFDASYVFLDKSWTNDINPGDPTDSK